MTGKISSLDDAFNQVFKPDPASELAQARINERRAAEAKAFHASAYRQMPEDLRTRAKVWGVSELMTAIWMNAWENGYKQAVRDVAETGGAQ